MAEMPPLGTPGVAPPLYEEGARARGPNGELAVFTNGEWQIKNRTTEDIKNAAVPSLVRGGASFLTTGRGLYDTAAGLIGKGADKFLSPENAETAKTAMADLPKSSARYNPVLAPFLGPTQEEMVKKAEDLTGRKFDYQAETPIGQMAQTGLELLPSVAAGPGGVIRKAGSLLGATAGSEAGGWLGSKLGGDNGEPTYEGWGRVLGAGLGQYAPTIARKAVTPVPLSANRQAQNKKIEDAGVKQTAGQAIGSGFWNQLEKDNLGSSKGKGLIANQQTDFGKFANREAGVTGPEASRGMVDLGELQPTMRTTGRKIEQGYRAATPKTDAKLTSEMNDIYTNSTPATQKLLQPHMDAIMYRPTIAGTSGQKVPGKGFLVSPNSRLKGNELRQRINSLTQEADVAAGANDIQSASALRGLGATLRGSVDRSLTGTVNEGLPGSRQQYTNQKALENLRVKQGSTPTADLPPTPRDVYQALGGTKNPNAQSNRLGQVADLAGRRDIGAHNTPDFSSYFHHPGYTIAGAGLGAAGQYISGKNDSVSGVDLPITGLLSAGAIAAYARSNPLMARALLSGPGQNWLKNQKWQPGRNTDPSHISAALIMGGMPSKPEDAME